MKRDKRKDIIYKYSGNYDDPHLGPGYIDFQSTFYKPKKGGLISLNDPDAFMTELNVFQPGPGEYDKRSTFYKNKKKKTCDFSKKTKRSYSLLNTTGSIGPGSYEFKVDLEKVLPERVYVRRY